MMAVITQRRHRKMADQGIDEPREPDDDPPDDGPKNDPVPVEPNPDGGDEGDRKDGD